MMSFIKISKSSIIALSFILSSVSLFSQARLVLNDNVNVVMDGGTAPQPVYLVVDNPNANAITTTGGGGKIESENEYHKIRWNIGNSTGNYAIPFVTENNVKIPFSMQITGAGSGGTHVDFSTFPTTTMNFDRPSMVTHMLDAATASVDNSMWVIDRFWVLDAMNYTTRPTTNMTFGYDPNETAGNNLTPGAMEAQRFKSTTNEWSGSPSMSYLSWGTDNVVNDEVSGVVPGSAELYEAWTLVDGSNLLSVELKDFDVNCQESIANIKWTTASESDLAEFIIERSLNSKLDKNRFSCSKRKYQQRNKIQLPRKQPG